MNNMNKRKAFLPLLLRQVFVCLSIAVFLCGGVASAGMDVHLRTKRLESKLIEVAVPWFSFRGADMEEMGRRAAHVITNDLKFTTYFKPSENYDFMWQASRHDEKLGSIDFKEWRTIVSNFVVKGAVSTKPDGLVLMEITAYDLQMKSVFLSKKYEGKRSMFRQMAHQFSDDFFNRLTGEHGVARTKMAFVSKVKGRKELFVMDYDGFSPRGITNDRSLVLLPDWNAKRNLILFTTYRYRNPDLYALDLKAGIRYPISRRVGLNAAGEWSPDGTRVAFSISRKGNTEIYVSDADGSHVRRLTASRAIETSPAWSPDGKKIAFTSDRSGSPQIYVMNADGTGKKKRVTYSGGYNDGAAWSPKGDFIAYSSLIGGKFNIAMVHVTNRSVIQLTYGAYTNESPSWSPTGGHIAFTSNRSGQKQVFIMNSNGSSQKQVTFLQGGGYSPSWGPGPE
ncbi:Tol-Pal system beta propeller repeat protein TolB [hydrothermal vent metagenome]|uniref:Tol-Pal system beta propeller repeat protein TolB n=1 Tax=hydrothermal vent metagenome TaxID=652676 RepID=A0A3B1BP09_9ZZZZ